LVIERLPVVEWESVIALVTLVVVEAL